MLNPDQLSEAEHLRRSRLAAKSQDEDTILVEMIYHGKWVTFDLSSMELQFLTGAALWARHFQPAFAALHVPTALEETPALLASSATNA